MNTNKKSTRRHFIIRFSALLLVCSLMVIGLGSGQVLAKKIYSSEQSKNWMRDNATVEWVAVDKIKVTVTPPQSGGTTTTDENSFNTTIFSGTYNIFSGCLSEDGKLSDDGKCAFGNGPLIYQKPISRGCSDDTPSPNINTGMYDLNGSNSIRAPNVNSSTVELHFAIQVGDDCVITQLEMPAKTSPSITQEQVDNFDADKQGIPVPSYDPNDCSDPANDGRGNCTLIKAVVVPAINLMGLLVGVVVVLSIVIAGIQYITAGGNSQQVAAAKGRIFNAVLALVVYIVGFALLQWLIPGGVFHS